MPKMTGENTHHHSIYHLAYYTTSLHICWEATGPGQGTNAPEQYCLTRHFPTVNLLQEVAVITETLRILKEL